MKNDPQSPVRRKPAGGVRSVRLTAVSNLGTVTFIANGAVCSLCEIADEGQVMECRPIEDESEFVEKLTADDGSFAVRHTLRVVSDRNGA